MEVLGFATQDFSGTKGDTLKVASMDVFTQSTCNAKLEKKLTQNKECKFLEQFHNFYLILQEIAIL